LKFYGNFRHRTTVEKNLCIKSASCTDLSDPILDPTDLCKTQICAGLGNRLRHNGRSADTDD
jgi:hypothetical protein